MRPAAASNRKKRREDAQPVTRPPAKKKKEEVEMDIDAFLGGGFREVGQETRAKDEEEESEGEGESDSDEEGGETSHKKQLEALREKDPDFFQYLQANDSALLDFEDDDDDDDDTPKRRKRRQTDDESEEEEDEEDDDGDGDGDGGDDKGSREPSLTIQQVERYATDASGGSLAALKRLTSAYRLACSQGTGTPLAEDAATNKGKSGKKKAKRRQSDDDDEPDESLAAASEFANVAASGAAVMATLEAAPAAFNAVLLGTARKPPKEHAALRKALLASPRWTKTKPLLRTFFGNTLRWLREGSDGRMLDAAYRSLGAAATHLSLYPRLLRKTTRAALSHFSGDADVPRVASFLFLRNLAPAHPSDKDGGEGSGHAALLRLAFRSFASKAAFHTAATAPALEFMSKAVGELVRQDPAACYAPIFVCVKELAMTLRKALEAKTKEAYADVCSWQFVHALSCWSRCLAELAGDRGARPLEPLVHPVAQLLLGAVRAAPPTMRFAPMRLRLCHECHLLAAAYGRHAPVASVVCEVLALPDLRKAASDAGNVGATRAPPVHNVLRVSAQQATSAAYQREVVETAMWLLSANLAGWSHTVGFPELAHGPCSEVRAFRKVAKAERMRTLATKFLRAVEATSEAVRRRRGNAEEGLRPGDRDACAAFAAARGGGEEGALDALAQEWGEGRRKAMVGLLGGRMGGEKVIVGGGERRVVVEEEEEEEEEDFVEEEEEDFVEEEEGDLADHEVVEDFALSDSDLEEEEEEEEEEEDS